MGRSRGRRTTRIHAVADSHGRLIAFAVNPGQRGDVRPAADLVAPLPAARTLLADAAYDRDAIRIFLEGRNIIERAFFRFKDWRRVATRYDKLARNFNATLMLAILTIWWT